MRAKALYRNGVLKLLEKVNLQEGEEVEIEIFTKKEEIEKAFNNLKKIIPSLDDSVEETVMDKYMDKEYALRKIGI